MKRQYPFNNFGSCHQRKIHIGLKEINLGIESNQRMPDVYEKTMNLMWSNEKKRWSYNYMRNKGDKENANVNVMENILSNKREYKQLTLENYAKSNLSNPIASSAHDYHSPCLKPCSFCLLSTGTLTQTVCNFCEGSICSNCCRRCFRCNEIFCSLCSIKIYSEKEDSAKCFSC